MTDKAMTMIDFDGGATPCNDAGDSRQLSPTVLLAGYLHSRVWQAGDEIVLGDLYLMAYISNTTPRSWSWPFNASRPSPRLDGFEWEVINNSFSDYRIRLTRVPPPPAPQPVAPQPPNAPDTDELRTSIDALLTLLKKHGLS